jgi:hypothetical protein
MLNWNKSFENREIEEEFLEWRKEKF